jgi:hypothetical protein
MTYVSSTETYSWVDGRMNDVIVGQIEFFTINASASLYATEPVAR